LLPITARAAPREAQRLAGGTAEEIPYCLDAVRACDGRDVGRRFYAQRTHAFRLKAAQQTAIVAGDFHHQIIGGE
jgi:hypothetical protein